MTPPIVVEEVTPVSQLDKVATHKLTTVSGMAIVLITALMPPDIRDSCYTAVVNSSSPLFTSGLLLAGLGLTVLGPSIKNVDPSILFHKWMHAENIKTVKEIQKKNEEP